MQEVISKRLTELEYTFRDEFRVPEVGRVADFLVYGKLASPYKVKPICNYDLINIEAKSNNFTMLIEQMNDHAQYCDYSFAAIPDYPIPPKWFMRQLLVRGYGLIVYNFNTKEVTEALVAYRNLRLRNPELRKKILKELSKKK